MLADDEAQLALYEQLQLVGGEDVRGIRDGDGDRLVGHAQRERVEAARDALGDEARGLAVDHAAFERGVREAELVGERLGDLVFVHEAVLDEELAEPLLRRGALGDRLRELVPVEPALAQKDLPELLAEALAECRPVAR